MIYLSYAETIYILNSANNLLYKQCVGTSNIIFPTKNSK